MAGAYALLERLCIQCTPRALIEFSFTKRRDRIRKKLSQRIVLACAAALAGLALLADEASAQLEPGAPPPPTDSSRDANGVDIITGRFHFSTPSISIGRPGAGGLTYVRHYDSSRGFSDNFLGTINATESNFTVTVMGASMRFTQSGGGFTPADGHGGLLTFNSGTNTYTYTTRDGTIAIFSKDLHAAWPYQANEGLITSLTYPTGEVLTLHTSADSELGEHRYDLEAHVSEKQFRVSNKIRVRDGHGVRRLG